MMYEQGKTQKDPNVCFKSGDKVKVTNKEMYLGGQVTVQYNTSYEVGRRIALGQNTYREMKRIFLCSRQLM